MNYFNIYKASAGSGKTYTLAKEYIKLSFIGERSFREILAVTFTNKATAEMKSRIISNLIILSQGKGNKLADEIKNELILYHKRFSNLNIEKKSKEVLEGILHNYSDFSVSTIDSFSVNILKSFSKELKIPFGFELETDTYIVLKTITESLLDNIGVDRLLTDYIEKYIIYKLYEEGNWRIEQDIKKIGDEIFKERYWLKIKELGKKQLFEDKKEVSEFSDILKNIKSDFENNVNAKLEEAKKIIQDNGLKEENFVQKSKGIWSYLTGNHEKWLDLSKARLKEAVFEHKVFNPKLFVDEYVIKETISLIKDIYNYCTAEVRKYVTVNAVLKNIYAIGIFTDLIEELKKYRSEQRILLSTDINNLINALISDDISPFLYEKTGNRYKYFLIDEFQDTSNFQWSNFKPLIINSLSENNTSLIVGDVKQSIYRWRNGDMNLLLSQVSEDLEAFKSLIKINNLEVNFRSRKNIVDFNNLFFSSAGEYLPDNSGDYYKNLVSKIYNNDEVSQKVPKSKNTEIDDIASGYVRLRYIPKQKNENNKGEEEENNTDKTEKIKPNDVSCEDVMNIIKEVLADGYSPSDILILIRTTADGRQIATAVSQKYKVVTAEALSLDSSFEVKLLLNLLRYITDKKNKLAERELLYSYCRLNNIGDEIINNVLYGDTNISDFLPQDFFSKDDKTKLNPVLNELSLYDLTERLISIFGLNKTPSPYLIKFLDSVIQYTKKYDSDILSFLEWWEDKSSDLKVTMPESEDSINIMTIHKAKGLQRKIVIIPFANWEFNPWGKNYFWARAEENIGGNEVFYLKAVSDLQGTLFAEEYEREAALTRIDNINLLYVAFTRAADRLYINVPEKAGASDIYKFIYNIITKKKGFADMFSENIYECGVNGKYEDLYGKEKKKTDTATEMITVESNDWYKKTIIKSSFRKIKLLGLDENDNKLIVSTNRGVVIHEILSRIKYPSDIPEALSNSVIDGLITDEEKNEFGNILNAIISDEKISPFFDNSLEIISESDILLPDGSVIRPDRVLVKDNSAIVIDYKTGAEKPEHKIQVDNYGLALSQMGFKNVKKYLLYITDSENLFKLVEV